MTSSTVGLFVGLLLGVILIFKGFGAMLVVAFFGSLGYVATKISQGEIDVNRYLGGPTARR